MGIWNLIFGKILNPFSYMTFPPTNQNGTEENQSSSSNTIRKSRKRRKTNQHLDVGLNLPQNSQQPLFISNEGGGNFIENGNGHSSQNPLYLNPDDSTKTTNDSSVFPYFPVPVPSTSSSSISHQHSHHQNTDISENGDKSPEKLLKFNQGQMNQISESNTRGVKRRRQRTYTQSEKERAVRLLNQGIPCRKVAEMIDERMSSGTPIRWRKKMRATVEAQHRLNESLLANNNNNNNNN